MAQRHIYIDKTELVLVVLGKKKAKSFNLTYDQIVRIQFDKCTERKLAFIKVPSEKISIVTRKRETPFIYTMQKEKKFFNEYKKEIEKFAKNNRITFVNNL